MWPLMFRGGCRVYRTVYVKGSRDRLETGKGDKNDSPSERHWGMVGVTEGVGE